MNRSKANSRGRLWNTGLEKGPSVFKRISVCALAIVLLVTSLYIPPRRASAVQQTELYNIFFLPTESNPDPSNKKLIENYRTGGFEGTSENFEVETEEFNEKSSQFIKRTNEEAVWSTTVTREYENGLSLADYNELYFQACAKNGSGEFKLTVELFSDNGYHTVSGKAKAGAVYDVFCPVSRFEERDTINRISISVTCPEDTDSFVFSTIYADTDLSYAHITLFSAEDISSSGKISLSEDSVKVGISDNTGDMTATLSQVPEDAATVCSMVTLSGAENGTVTLSVRDGTSEEYTDISTLTLYPDRNKYSFMFPASNGTDGYRLSFAGITLTEGQELTVHSVAMEYFSNDVYGDRESLPCTIASCTVIEGGSRLRLSGTLRSSTVLSNLDSKLNIYAVDTLWETESEPILMASVDITTVFEITFGTEQLKMNPYFYKYYAAIVNDQANTVASVPVYPSVTPSNFTMGNSVLGIQSDDTSAAFITNASHAVVDIDLDKLLSTDGKGGRVHSYGGSFCYLSGSYISELDSRISFLNGSGVNVYLRILWANTDSSVNAVYRIPDSSSYRESLDYMTMIDFITARYSSISGIILGSRIDCLLYSYSDDSSLLSRAENYVELLRLTSIVSRYNASEAAVMVPFGDGYVYGGDGDGADFLYDSLSGIGEKAADPIMMSEVISQLIFLNGSFRWYLLYECESAPSEAMTTVYKMSGQLTQGSGASPSGHMVFWQPEKTITSQEISLLSEAITEKAVSLGTGAVIISVTKQSADTRIIFGIIEKSSFGENTFRKVTEHDGLVFLRPAPQGSVHLWDFTKAFSTEGFIGGGSVSSVSTEVSTPMAAFEGLDACRCLKGFIDTESSATGTVLCYFDTPKLLKNATALDVSLNIDSRSTSQVPVKVILGKGNVRFEYSALLTPNTPSVIRCDTGIMEEGFATEYIALSFEPDTATSVEVTKVSAINKNVSAEVLQSRLEVSEKDGPDLTDESKIFIVCMAFMGVTVIIFALLNVRSSDKKAQPDKKASDKGSR